MKALQFLVLLFSVTGTSAGFAKDPVMGMHPDQLLALLPKPPLEWKLESSIGSNEISAYPALLTFAIREYSFVPPPLPDGTIPPTQKCKLVLLDSALDPDRSLIYDDFSEPKNPESARQRGTYATRPTSTF